MNLARQFLIRSNLDSFYVKSGLNKFFHLETEKFEIPINKTFLRYARCPVTVNFPFFSDSWSLKLPDASRREVVMHYWRQFQQTKKQLAEALAQKHDLILYYTRLLDLVGELEYNFASLQAGYLAVNHFAMQVHNHLQNGDVLIVFSDHGIQPWKSGYGKHSCHGFWSCNKPIKPESCLDFYGIIGEMLT